jgi:hypothetical protein
VMVAGWPPSILTPVSDVERAAGDGLEVAEFVESLCVQVKDSIGGRAGSPLLLRPWQKMLLGDVFARRADGRRKHRTAIIGMARKNGKSALGSGIALHALMLGSNGGEVYSCAADRDQARIVFGDAKKMIEASKELPGCGGGRRDWQRVPGSLVGGVHEGRALADVRDLRRAAFRTEWGSVECYDVGAGCAG